MSQLHGNLYKMRENLFQASLYNQLPHDGIRLDGHYTILFTIPDFKLYVFQHGDYLNLVSFKRIPFTRFIELNQSEVEYLTGICKSTYERKSVSYYSGCYTSEVHFPYDYELFGTPDYLKEIPEHESIS